MNWASFKLGFPVASLGGLVAIGAYIGIKGDDFTIFNLVQIAKMFNLFLGAFISTLVSFLIGLKTTAPQDKWDGVERRTIGDDRRQNPEIPGLKENK
jgi:hypothetical protein